MKSIGIDIGSSSIKVVEAVSGSKGVSVISAREFPIGNNPSIDVDLEILDILKGIAHENDPRKTRITMALKQDFVSSRFKVFPFNDRLKILKSLPFELDEEFPFSTETAIYEARIGRNVGPVAEVLAVAAPKNRIAQFLKQVSDSGLEITLLTAEGLALANCYQKWWAAVPSVPPLPPELEDHPPIRRLKARVHIGHLHTVVLAFDGEQLVGARSVLWGSKMVAEAISRRYEIPYVEAIKEMKTKAFILTNKTEASYDQILFSDTIATQVAELGKEVRISLLELQTGLGGEVDEVEISGGFSQTHNLQAFLTQVLEIPVNRSQYLNSHHTLFEKRASYEATLGVALGLALEGLRKARNAPVQFLRGEFAKQSDSLKEKLQVWSPTLKFLGIFWVLFFTYAYLRDDFSLSLVDSANETLKKQARQVARLAPKQANEAGVKGYIRTQRRQIEEQKDLAQVLQMNNALELLKKLSSAAPGRNSVNLVVRKFQVTDNKVQLSGILPQANQIKTVESAFQSVATGKVRSSVGNPAPGSGQVAFSMEFEMSRGLSSVQ